MVKDINPFNTLRTLKGGKYHYYSLPALEEKGGYKLKRLPVSIRIMLESLLRNCNDHLVREEDIVRLANWRPGQEFTSNDVPFVVSRVILQDFTGVPLLVDLAAMRDAMMSRKQDAASVEPGVPVDLVIDHSVQVDRARTSDSFIFNLGIEFERNYERYAFLKWGQQAYKTLGIVPPGIGIVHQVNLEYIAPVVIKKEQEGKTFLYPDTLVGTDSHTTMINGLGVLGWGVGGIEAEAAMLGQPVFLQMPEVIGVHLSGALKEGVTATDLTLRITQMLRKENVVGKFVEFFGEGAASLTVADRATIGNMAPEYGATIGFFAVDDKTIDYLRMTGRSEEHLQLVKDYLEAQELYGVPRDGEIDYSKQLELDLNSIKPCVSGPKRPQDHIELPYLKRKFEELLQAPLTSEGYGKIDSPTIGIRAGGIFDFNQNDALPEGGKSSLNGTDTWSEAEMVTNRPFTDAIVNPGYLEMESADAILKHGSVVIAAITSCTNTSNPSVMIGAGLVAKKAVEKGLKVHPMIKTSLAPGSRVVTDYLEKTGLQQYLNQLGFQLVAYGCTTCIGNSGPLDENIEQAIKKYDLIAASVLSGNRNFEARIHSAVKANFLMSPPLVVAFALAGRVDIDMDKEPLGMDSQGHPVYLRDIWPTTKEIQEEMSKGIQPSMFKERYAHVTEDNQLWKEISIMNDPVYQWDSKSSYIQKPPYFDHVDEKIPSLTNELLNMRALALFGDSVTTDHISPAGSIKADSPAGKYLLSLGVKERDFNSYGSRRGNHHVMVRGTFANVRLRNHLAGSKEGGYTKLIPEGSITSIYEASEKYAREKTPLIIFSGRDYGMGSSRDWAAKGTALLGVKVVVARSFERIHRSNLIGMGVLPLEFMPDESYESLGITGEEMFSVIDLQIPLIPQQEVTLEIKSEDGVRNIKLRSRLDTASEVEYYRHGGILPFILRQYLKKQKNIKQDPSNHTR